ncbi:hypothetical protein [Lactococcus formosensis]|uniref:hypothetical protein n=1 Tax=Lactococcus formosensis TaxID=1281486 RepID=UPI0030CEFF6B
MLLLLLKDNEILDGVKQMTYNQHSTAQHSTAQHSTAPAVDIRLFLLAPKRSGPLGAFFGIYNYQTIESIEMRKTYDTR